MPTHAEVKVMPYTQAQMYDLVLDVDRYPEFLPWCLGAKIWKRDEGALYADLVIGYGVIRERFTSKVTFTPNSHIHVEYLKGPMKHLSNHWKFASTDNNGCEVDFFVDFEFKNPILRKVMGVFFNEAVRVMVRAFEARAQQLYRKG